MISFAFIVGPPEAAGAARLRTPAGLLPARAVEKFFGLAPPIRVAGLTGILLPRGQAVGCLVSVPLSSGRHIAERAAAGMILRACRTAAGLGAGVVGLGEIGPVPEDTLRQAGGSLKIAVSTGTVSTLAATLEGVSAAARIMGHSLKSARVTVLGAMGPAGRVFALMLAREAKRMTLAGLDRRRLEDLAAGIYYDGGLSVKITPDVKGSLREADIIVAAGPWEGPAVGPEDLRPGTVVWDLARPRSVSADLAGQRGDVLVVEDAVLELPGADFLYRPGFPPGTACPRLAEAIILAAGEGLQQFPAGRQPGVRQVGEMAVAARKLGFKLAGFKSYNRFLNFSDAGKIRDGLAVAGSGGQLGRGTI